MAIAKRMATADPSNAHLQHNPYSHTKMGDALLAERNLSGLIVP